MSTSSATCAASLRNRWGVIGDTEKHGTLTRFKADKQIFEDTEFSFDVLSNRLRELAFLTKGIHIAVTDERTLPKKSHIFHFDGGVKSFIEYLNKNRELIHPEPVYFDSERDSMRVEVGLQYNDSFNETIFTFANNINTREGGTHLVGFKSALTRCLNDYMKKLNLSKKLEENLSGEDVREGLTAVISVKVPEPQFEGQTKARLGNSDVKGVVESLAYDRLSLFFDENPEGRQADPRQVDYGGQGARGRPQGTRAHTQEGAPGEHGSSGEARRLLRGRPGKMRAVYRGRGLRWRQREAGEGQVLPGHSSQCGAR